MGRIGGNRPLRSRARQWVGAWRGKEETTRRERYIAAVKGA